MLRLSVCLPAISATAGLARSMLHDSAEVPKNMLTAIQPTRSTLFKARWRDTMTQSRKGARRLRKGIRSFAGRRRGVLALLGASAVLAVGIFWVRR